MSDALADVVAQVGIEYDPAGAKRAKDSLASVIKGAKALAAAFVAHKAVSAIRGLVEDVAELGDKVDKASGRIGINAEALQELRYAADQTGVSSNTLDMAMQRLSRRYSEAAKGGGVALKTFQQFGISLRDSAGRLRPVDEVLSDVSAGLARTTDRSEQLRLAFTLFDSEGAALVNTLRGGPEALAAMRAEGRRLGAVMDRELIARTVAYADAKGRLNTVLQSVKNALAKELIPFFLRATDWLTAFTMRLRDALRVPVAKSIGVVSQLLGSLRWALVQIGAAIAKLLDPSTTLGKVLLTISGVLLALSGVLTAAPVLVAAVSAAFLILVDDIRAFLQGGESLIGRLLNWFRAWLAQFPQLQAAISATAGWLSRAVDAAVALFNRASAGAIEAARALWPTIVDLGQSAIATAQRAWSVIAPILDFLLTNIVENAKVAWRIFSDLISDVVAALLRLWPQFRATLGAIAKTASWLINWIIDAVSLAFSVLGPVLGGAWKAARWVLLNVLWPVVRFVVQSALGLLVIAGKVVLVGIRAGLATIRGVATLVLSIVRGLVDGVVFIWRWLVGIFISARDGFLTGIDVVSEYLWGRVRAAIERLQAAFGMLRRVVEPVLELLFGDEGPQTPQSAPGGPTTGATRSAQGLTALDVARGVGVVSGASGGPLGPAVSLPGPVLSEAPRAAPAVSATTTMAISVHPSPGMDERQLAELVAARVREEQERQTQHAYRDVLEGLSP